MRYVGLLDVSETGAFGVSFPGCPSCTAMGKDENEALANAVEAFTEWLGELAPGERPSLRSVSELRGDPEVEDSLRDGAVFVPAPFVDEGGRLVCANISIDAGLLESIDETAKFLGLTRSAFVAQAAREKIGRSA